MAKILVAGASGFIGKALIEMLLHETDHTITAISRSERESTHPRLVWKRCDLFSLKDIKDSMEGVDIAFYLVHSMLPSAGLSQGKFYDFDLLLADNFKRAAVLHGLRHIIYLGGMIPEGAELSWHLKSRLEVEDTLRSSSIPVTALRAGLIIGPGGSSFTLIERLITRLPMLVCPAWTQTRSQPIALGDVLRVLKRAINDQALRGHIYDIAGNEVVSYQDLIAETAVLSGLKRPIFKSNLIPIGLSRLWVTLITGAPRNLVYPLILSLKHAMLVNQKYRWPHPEDLRTPLKSALTASLGKVSHNRSKPPVANSQDVRSIQRMILPIGKSAAWVVEAYFAWLPSFFSSLIRILI